MIAAISIDIQDTQIFKHLCITHPISEEARSALDNDKIIIWDRQDLAAIWQKPIQRMATELNLVAYTGGQS